ncbi:hypothetical protein [Nostoc sp. KVJ3]|uniref:hypothetical protein n=1 Tax=Nostoc sp. KVJ3 TaxID=457945 RepID=UPI0022374DC7|nr:hypothetical protein [Nostoc sp. KVJ3]
MPINSQKSSNLAALYFGYDRLVSDRCTALNNSYFARGESGHREFFTKIQRNRKFDE